MRAYICSSEELYTCARARARAHAHTHTHTHTHTRARARPRAKWHLVRERERERESRMNKLSSYFVRDWAQAVHSCFFDLSTRVYDDKMTMVMMIMTWRIGKYCVRLTYSFAQFMYFTCFGQFNLFSVAARRIKLKSTSTWRLSLDRLR